ncbi:hypothetical protein HDC90_001138 [Pedobacter sp. AK013]|uniref:hypothetical protein n=1 Tax=Pedobacter sp. AK013 TaxID=2723071 RepID=UPI0016072F18|nr:hypothetical protein [Pedobacter sp. AK013]MBB6236526.1 hypothetical protein [Pedobacter sp. AK013]
MKKQQLEMIFGKGRVNEIDGELSVSVVHTLGVQETTKLNAFCNEHGLDYNVKPASGCMYIKIFNK